LLVDTQNMASPVMVWIMNRTKTPKYVKAAKLLCPMS
jgi:hypothetical protein